MKQFKVVYRYLDEDPACTHSVVFNSEFELFGGLSVFLNSELIGTDKDVSIINIETLNS